MKGSAMMDGHLPRGGGQGMPLLAAFLFLFLLVAAPARAGNNDFEVIRQAAAAYLAAGEAERVYPASDLWARLTNGRSDDDPFVVSARFAKHYRMNHICGALLLPWNRFFKPESLAQLPAAGRPVVVYCYTGHDAGQIVPFLRMLGWDAHNLKWGFTSWIKCPNGAPGLFQAATFGGIGQNYPTETEPREATAIYPLPVVRYTAAEERREILRAAAEAWFDRRFRENGNVAGEDKYKVQGITPKELFMAIAASDPQGVPFVLDVRPAEEYRRGHIAGAVSMPLAEMGQRDRLQRLPPDRRIAVVSRDGMAGSQLTAILGALGYRAVNLEFGMTAWTRNEQVAPGRFVETDPVTKEPRDLLKLDVCFGDDPLGK